MFLSVVLAFFASCGKKTENKTERPPAPVVDIWNTIQYQPALTLPDSNVLVGSKLSELDTFLGSFKAKQGIPQDYIEKINGYVKTPADSIHSDLLKLRGWRISVFAMEHQVAHDDSNEQSAQKSQTDIGNMLQAEKYEVMFTEDFTSDAGLLTKERILADFTREARDAGYSDATPEQSEKIVLDPIVNDGVSASVNMWMHNPNIDVVGVDYYPIKRIQQHHMSECFNPSRSYVVEQIEGDQFMLCMSLSRDLYLLRTIANLPKYFNKKCAIVFGARHSAHLIKLLVAYGVNTSLRINSQVQRDPGITEEFATQGVALQ